MEPCYVQMIIIYRVMSKKCVLVKIQKKYLTFLRNPAHLHTVAFLLLLLQCWTFLCCLYITRELTPKKQRLHIFYNNHDKDYLQANGFTLSATPRIGKTGQRNHRSETIVIIYDSIMQHDNGVETMVNNVDRSR